MNPKRIGAMFLSRADVWSAKVFASCAFLAVCCLAIIVSTPPAWADVVLVTPDRSEPDDLTLSPGDTIRVAMQEGRSYECSLTQKLIETGDPFITFDLEATDPDGDNFTVSAVGNIEPVITAPAGQSSLKSRISLIATKTGIYTLALDFSSATSDIATVRCYNTTLFGGFNTFFSELPIVEVSNTSSTKIIPTINAVDFAGNVVVEDSLIEVEANSRSDDVLSIEPNLYGQITVTYLGPKGALRGNVAEYNGTSSGLVLRRENAMSNAPALP